MRAERGLKNAHFVGHYEISCHTLKLTIESLEVTIFRQIIFDPSFLYIYDEPLWMLDSTSTFWVSSVARSTWFVFNSIYILWFMKTLHKKHLFSVVVNHSKPYSDSGDWYSRRTCSWWRWWQCWDAHPAIRGQTGRFILISYHFLCFIKMDTFTKIATRDICKIFLVTAEVPWAILLQLFSLKLWSFYRNFFQKFQRKKVPTK